MEKVKMTEKQEKLVNLMKNKEFVDKVISQQSVADVQRLFKGEGVELSEADVEALGDIIDIALQKGEILTDEIIEKVSAGLSDREIPFMGAGIGLLVGPLIGAVLGSGAGLIAGTIKGEVLAQKQISNSPDKYYFRTDIDRVRAEHRLEESDKATEIGLLTGYCGGAVIGAVAGALIAKSLCRWKKR